MTDNQQEQEEDLLFEQMQEQTADLEPGDLIDATADGVPGEDNEPPQMPESEP